MFRNHVPPNFEGVRRRNSVWGLHRYAGTAGTRRESRAPEHSLLPAYARGARRNMSGELVLSDSISAAAVCASPFDFGSPVYIVVTV